MKITRLWLICSLALALPLAAQGYVGNGYVLSRFRTYTAELPLLSSFDNSFGTARSSAMGGAYASLGADLSSITINPAGLGLYSTSEFSFSPSLTLSRYRNSGPLIMNGKGDTNTAFKPNNVGMALNMYEGYHRSLSSFTFGFSYTRLADYNYISNVSLSPDDYSLAQIFALQLWGIHKNDVDINGHPWINGLHPNQWGAALAYQTGLIGVYLTPQDPEWANKAPSLPGYANMYEELQFRTYYPRGAGGPSTLHSHDLRTISKGSSGEYNIAGGFDFNSTVYFGFSLGLIDLYRKQDIFYSENYTHNDAENPAQRMSYVQHTKTTGSGVNFKLGLIVNPADGLRFGLALHTPTWHTVAKDYAASMGVGYQSANSNRSTDVWTYEYKYNTPGKATAGISYTFGNKGLISLDYGVDFYNWMRISVPDEDRYYEVDGKMVDEFAELKKDVKDSYKPRHIIKAGGEFKPIPEFALRAGFAYYGSFLKDNDAIFNEPLPYRSMNVSGGLGYRFSDAISLDLAYVYMKTDYSKYDIFHYDGPDNSVNGKARIFYTDAIESDLTRHNLILTVGYRF